VDEAMFYGTAGDIVGAIAPHTEAHPVALLAQLLTALGSAAGRHVHIMLDGAEHYPNLFVLVVGSTAKARKGTSWWHAERVMRDTAPDWYDAHIVRGLASGEGIVHALRDVNPADIPLGDDGALLRDKRLLAFESEFASVLAQKSRDGSILSAILRAAWDGVPFGTLTKHAPEQASKTHVSLIGHITADELVRCVSATDVNNGLLNRFLLAAVRRANLLPFGGDLEAVTQACERHVTDLRVALQWAQTPRRLAYDRGARELWALEYERLTAERPGLYGALTARAEAQVSRLALLYALLDCVPDIRVGHLRAALALWRYCEASVRHIFGDRLGDTVADAILDALRTRGAAGMTRTEISDLLGRNAPASRIANALGALVHAGLASWQAEATGERGRPAEHWYARSPLPAAVRTN
jgi:hypothetical protein